jgi:hypothetical protein
VYAALGKAVNDYDILPFDPRELAQALSDIEHYRMASRSRESLCGTLVAATAARPP